MDLQFGESVKNESARLESQGIDQNQIAGILCKKDPHGFNYGIGIMLDGAGKPMASSSTLLEYIAKEVQESKAGNYMNSASLMEELTRAVLRWQRIPENCWKQFKLILPSDGGTGAVQTAVTVALLLHPDINTLGIEELGWPAYAAIAKSARVKHREFPMHGVMNEEAVLPIYQAGPINTTGSVQPADVIRERAKTAARLKVPVVLDRAYSGFEFARLQKSRSYDEVMKKSFELQLKPFMDEGASFLLAISPTKAFVTFSLRPCGFLLAYIPDASREKEISLALTSAIRARGSSFEHPITRAFVKAFTRDQGRLEAEHMASLERVAVSENRWALLSRGSPMESLFTDKYAGLFRNPLCKPEAPLHIYNEHMYPVFSKDRCRLNVTGIPDDDALAKKHVDVFSRFCH
jgi:aspartate/tyrosine/aromatic aminotransferase